jgi:hypothetical protein
MHRSWHRKLMLSEDPEIIRKTSEMAREARETTSKVQGNVRRLQWRLQFVLDWSGSENMGEVLP